MKKIVGVCICVCGLLGLIFISGLGIKQHSSLIKKGSVCVKSEGMYNRVQGAWINMDSKESRDALSLTINKDTLTCWNGFREEMYKLNISEDSLFGGVQLQNEQERLKYKPKVFSQQKIVKLTKDSLVFLKVRYYRKK